MEVLSWVYSTYPAYASDDASHRTALEYAEELFMQRGEANEYSYQLLGAAMYSNGKFDLGDQYFDRAIEGAPTEFLEQMFKRDKKPCENYTPVARISTLTRSSYTPLKSPKNISGDNFRVPSVR